MIKTVTEIRNSFWESYPQYKAEYRVKKRQNDYRTDIRCDFVDYVNHLHSSGDILDKLAQRVTL